MLISPEGRGYGHLKTLDAHYGYSSMSHSLACKARVLGVRYINRENLPVWKMFPFLDEREKYKIRPSNQVIKVKQSKVHAASKGSADAGGISSDM